MTKRKTIVERKWNLWKLRSWLLKHGLLDKDMPCMWSCFDCDNPNNPVNEWCFTLADSRTERLEKVAAVIRRNGGFARVVYNELSDIANDPVFYDKPMSTTWSYLVINMKGDVITVKDEAQP